MVTPLRTQFSGRFIPAGWQVRLSALSRHQPLKFHEPPPIPLDTDHKDMIRILLQFGSAEAIPGSPAERFGMTVFQAARHYARQTHYDGITFDWDHTVSNYKVFEDLGKLVPVKMSPQRPETRAQAPMTVVEGTRPYMAELVMGLMTGFALQQGLRSFSEWGSYEPQVGLATLTWPDRLARIAESFIRFVPLMDGRIPGSAGLYKAVLNQDTRTIVHLHNFLGYADTLLDAYEKDGFGGLNPSNQAAVMGYFEDGKAHYRKPLGAFEARGWQPESLLHFDDALQVIADIQADTMYAGARAVYTPNPYTHPKNNVGEPDKVLVGDLLFELLTPWQRNRNKRIGSAIKALVSSEIKGSSIHEILDMMRGPDSHPNALGARMVHDDEEMPQILSDRSYLLEGGILTYHLKETTLGEFWDYYVKPSQDLKTRIRKLIRQNGGLRQIRRDYAAAQAAP